MVTTIPTIEEVIVAFNEAVRFIGENDMLQEFADSLETNLTKLVVFNVSVYMEDMSDEEFKRCDEVSAAATVDRILKNEEAAAAEEVSDDD